MYIPVGGDVLVVITITTLLTGPASQQVLLATTVTL